MGLKKNSSYVGKRRNRHSIHPMSLRNPFMPQYLGGSSGYRGGNWAKERSRALARAGYKSEVTGLPLGAVQVDHIYPYRLGGKSTKENLRVINREDVPAVDNAYTMRLESFAYEQRKIGR